MFLLLFWEKSWMKTNSDRIKNLWNYKKEAIESFNDNILETLDFLNDCVHIRMRSKRSRYTQFAASSLFDKAIKNVSNYLLIKQITFEF